MKFSSLKVIAFAVVCLKRSIESEIRDVGYLYCSRCFFMGCCGGFMFSGKLAVDVLHFMYRATGKAFTSTF